MPTVYLPHGGGPWPFVDLGVNDPEGFGALRAYLESLPSVPSAPPQALLVISAHWEESVPTVMVHPQPPLLFDYFGFPPESYRLTWPAPGAPALGARVRGLLEAAGFSTAADTERGFDHGTFVPLKVAYPAPTLPVLQLSLMRGLDPKRHLELGRALTPVRDEGVFILGSGMSFHNLRMFMDPRARLIAEGFDEWLRDTATQPAAARDERLIEWASAPLARLAHPREEHLLPLMVVAGAAGQDRATIPYNGTYAGLRLSAYQFG